MKDTINITIGVALGIVALYMVGMMIGGAANWMTDHYNRQRSLCIERTQNPMYCYERYR